MIDFVELPILTDNFMVQISHFLIISLGHEITYNVVRRKNNEASLLFYFTLFFEVKIFCEEC